MSDAQNHVQLLIEKSSKAAKSEDAIRFSQAAVNIAHAVHTMWQVAILRAKDQNDETI